MNPFHVHVSTHGRREEYFVLAPADWMAAWKIMQAFEARGRRIFKIKVRAA